MPCLRLTTWRPSPWKWLIERIWASLKNQVIDYCQHSLMSHGCESWEEDTADRSAAFGWERRRLVLDSESFLLCARKEHFYIFPMPMRLGGRVTPRLNRTNCKAARSVGCGKGFAVCFWPGWAKTEGFTKVSLWPERQSIVNSGSRKACEKN